jgi:hypothetical protein
MNSEDVKKNLENFKQQYTKTREYRANTANQLNLADATLLKLEGAITACEELLKPKPEPDPKPSKSAQKSKEK